MSYKPRSIYALLLIFVIIAFFGCSKEETAYVRTMQLSAYGVSFDAEGGSREIIVTPHPEGECWEVTGEATWFNFKIDGNTLTINAKVESKPPEIPITKLSAFVCCQRRNNPCTCKLSTSSQYASLSFFLGKNGVLVKWRCNGPSPLNSKL